jgi:transposase
VKDRVEIIARTERRRKFSDAEKVAILAEADADGVSVRQVTERYEIAVSLI